MEIFTIGQEDTGITYKIEKIGEDFDITITGGKEHIGCAALISNRSYDIMKVATHREDELIIPIAEKLAKKETATILIKAGFHIDDITSNQIRQVLKNNKKAIKLIEEYINSN